MMDRIRQRFSRSPADALPVEATSSDREIISAVAEYSMATPIRIWNAIRLVRYAVDREIPGDIVECGVWRGGISFAMLLEARRLGDVQRRLYMYDTFEGMTQPSALDRDAASQTSASELLRMSPRQVGSNIWCIAGMNQVDAARKSLGIPDSAVRMIAGDVLNTLAEVRPAEIAVLRLDTDWYESTRAELETLYPLLSTRGALIVDDYGHWLGARRAVDEFLASQSPTPFVHVVDGTARYLIKE